MGLIYGKEGLLRPLLGIKGYSDGALAGVNPSNVSAQTSAEVITVQFASTAASSQSEMTFSWSVSAEL